LIGRDAGRALRVTDDHGMRWEHALARRRDGCGRIALLSSRDSVLWLLGKQSRYRRDGGDPASQEQELPAPDPRHFYLRFFSISLTANGSVSARD
jgi:hypothetical protein